MGRLFALLTLSLALPLGMARPGHAEGNAFVVTYVEVTPGARDQAAGILRSLAEGSRKEDGNLRFEVLARRDRPHFALLETWRDEKAQQAHAAGAQTKGAREQLQPLLVAPYDERPHGGLGGASLEKGSDPGAGAVFVVTHVDVIPPKKDDGIAALKDLVDASIREGGTVRFEALQQNSRPNHFTLAEVWRDDAAREAHVAAPHSKRFRELLLPMSGSLFDERLYSALQ